jgi:hypothetical protein
MTARPELVKCIDEKFETAQVGEGRRYLVARPVSPDREDVIVGFCGLSPRLGEDFASPHEAEQVCKSSCIVAEAHDIAEQEPRHLFAHSLIEGECMCRWLHQFFFEILANSKPKTSRPS